MTGNEFKAGLKAIGWKQSDFARKVDTHKNTVARWVANGPPTWAAEYLGILLGLKDLNERFLAVPPRRVASNEQQPPA